MTFIRNLLSRHFYQRSLQYQLQFSYLLIVIVPFIIFGLLYYQITERALTKEAEKNNNSLMESVSKNIDSFLKSMEKESALFATFAAQSGDFESGALSLETDELERWFKESHSPYDLINFHDFISIRTFANNGTLRDLSVNPRNGKSYGYDSPEETEWKKQIKSHFGDGIIFNVHPLEHNGIYSFTASRILIDPATGKRMGYISFDKSISSFTANFKQIEYRQGGEMQIIKQDGTLFYHSDYSRIGKRADEALLKNMKKVSADTIIRNIDGREIILSYNKLTQENFTIVGSMPLKVLTKEIGGLGKMTFYSVVLLALLISVLSYLLSVYLSRPIKKLTAQMKEVERGNLDIKQQMPESNIEIGQLSRSFYSMIEMINQLVTIQYQTEIRKKDAELKALIMQINPHFLYNTLEVINGIADEEGVDKISEMTQSLSQMLRYNIDLRREWVRIEDELNHCKHYFLIMKSRFEEDLRIEVDIDEAVHPFTMMKMTLQPLLENSIKHGVESKIGEGLIRLSARKEGEIIRIRISDNGVGFDPDKLEEFRQFTKDAKRSFMETAVSNHLGLKNVYTRLALLFGHKLTFRIDSRKNEGTVITIEFPAIQHESGSLAT